MRYGYLLSGLKRCVALKQGFVVLAMGMLALVATGQTAADRESWRVAISEDHSTGAGCFEAVYPSKVWKAVSCGTPTKKMLAPLVVKKIMPLDVEKVTGDYVLNSRDVIYSASGSLPFIENVTSVIGFGNVANEFNLQLNTESSFPGSAANSLCKQSKNSNCTGWLQFVYDSGGSINIQSWAINYGTCPSSLNLSGPQASCGKRTASYQLANGYKLWELAGAVLTGQVYKDSSGNIQDQVLLTVGNTTYKTSPSLDVVGAYGNWKTAQFNVYGNSGGDESFLNSGSLVSVALNINNDKGGVATCGVIGKGDTTGESTNMTLTPCVANSNPGITFNEGVAPVIASLSPSSGTSAGGTVVTITAQTSTTTPEGTPPVSVPVTYGFNPNAVVRFEGNNAPVKSCTTNTCVVTSLPGTGIVAVRAANVFKNGTLGPFSDYTTISNFTYFDPIACKLSIVGCPAEGGQQEYEVTCPSTVNFSVDGAFQKTGTFYVGSEAGAHQNTGVTACVPNTINCQSFTTSETQVCPIHPPTPPPPPLKNCLVCEQNNQQCVPVTGGYRCKGLPQ
jgi:hypothetical protein